jgi:type VI protein secretion system component VasK
MAASEYVQEAGHTELDARWIAEFFEESGVMEAYPEQNLIPFADMVQKELTKNAERASKNMLRTLDRIARETRKSSH